MYLPLKFATDIIRPWEKLNTELINQNSIDKDISDFTSMVQDLAVKISHFSELVNQKHIRTNKNCDEFTIIVDIADASKHGDSEKEKRNNKLSVSSLFEGNDEGTFRFVRNKVVVDHSKFGKRDFLETSKKAVRFLLVKLNLPLNWNPAILEAPNVFTDKVFLNIYYTHQIAWTGLGLEFVKRNSDGDLVHYDPKSWLFELRSPLTIDSKSYPDFLRQLIKRSINSSIDFRTNIPLALTDSSVKFAADFFFVDLVHSKESKTIVQILDGECTLDNIYHFQEVLSKTQCNRIILVSKTGFSNEIKQVVSNKASNIFLLTVNTQDAENIPLDFLKINYKHSNPKLIAITKSAIRVLQENEHLFSDLKGKTLGEFGNNFSTDKINLISFSTFCLSHVKQTNGKLNGKTKIDYKPRDKTHLYYKIDETFVKIGLAVEFEWEVEEKNLLMPILSFDKNSQGISVWNLETHYETPNGFQELKIPVTKYGDTSAIGMLI